MSLCFGKHEIFLATLVCRPTPLSNHFQRKAHYEKCVQCLLWIIYFFVVALASFVIKLMDGLFFVSPTHPPLRFYAFVCFRILSSFPGMNRSHNLTWYELLTWRRREEDWEGWKIVNVLMEFGLRPLNCFSSHERSLFVKVVFFFGSFTRHLKQVYFRPSTFGFLSFSVSSHPEFLWRAPLLTFSCCSSPTYWLAANNIYFFCRVARLSFLGSVAFHSRASFTFIVSLMVRGVTKNEKFVEWITNETKNRKGFLSIDVKSSTRESNSSL